VAGSRLLQFWQVNSLELPKSKILEEKARKPCELIRDLVGEEGSGRGDLSSPGEEILRGRFGKRK